MLINGVLTQEGLAKAVSVVGNSGLGIVPTGFGVASTLGAGGVVNTRTYASRVPTFYAAPLSNFADLGNGQVRFLATIPIAANGITALTPIVEIYIEGTLNGVPFLLMVAAPTTPTSYDPQGSLSFELTTQVLGTNLATAITFNSSQAMEITAHETNPVFHPKHTESNVAPTVADDASRGYVVGSTWLHIPTGQEYTCFSVAAGAAHWVASVQTTEKAAPNGVATLNAAGNPVQGLNARNGRCVPLPTTFDLNTIDSNYPSGIYDGFNFTNAPAIGWLYLELIKHVNWTGTNRWATVRATTFGSGNTANIIYARAVSNGVWGQWIKLQTSIDKGVANGLATLNAAGKLVQMPLPADIGLGSVNNTSDVSKPVSTAQQAALDGKANVSVGTLTGGISVIYPQHGLAANNGIAITLTVDTALDALSVTYPSGLYEVTLTVAQLGLPAGIWCLEYKRHSNDIPSSRNYNIVAYPINRPGYNIYQLVLGNRTWDNLPIVYGFLRISLIDAGYAILGYSVTSSPGFPARRVSGVTYTNTSSTRFLHVYATSTGNTVSYGYVSGVEVSYHTGTVTDQTQYFSVPPGLTYSFTGTLRSWVEITPTP